MHASFYSLTRFNNLAVGYIPPILAYFYFGNLLKIPLILKTSSCSIKLLYHALNTTDNTLLSRHKFRHSQRHPKPHILLQERRPAPLKTNPRPKKLVQRPRNRKPRGAHTRPHDQLPIPHLQQQSISGPRIAFRVQTASHGQTLEHERPIKFPERIARGGGGWRSSSSNLEATCSGIEDRSRSG